MLPNESLLQVLHFADYRTLVLAKLAGRRFLGLATKFAAELACRRSFRVTISTRSILYEDRAIRSLPERIRYEKEDRASFEAACRELAGVIGPHAVADLEFCENTWNMPHVAVIFETTPPLKYADEVDLSGVTGPIDAFMSNFAGTKSLRLEINSDVLHQFSWTFLRTESARERRRIYAFIKLSTWNEDADHFAEEIVRSCATLPRLLGEDELRLDFSDNHFSAAFVLRMIEMLKESGRAVTCRMSLWDQLTLDESEYAVDVNGTTNRYSSAKSGIVVEINGSSITIQSDAVVAATKECGETNGNVDNDSFRRMVLVRLMLPTQRYWFDI